jgi:hypothetical protein
MIDDQSEAGAWEAELARMGTHAPGANPPERCFLESFFRMRRSDPRFSLERGDLRLTREDQAMLVRLMRRVQEGSAGATTANAIAMADLLCERVSDVDSNAEPLRVEQTRRGRQA